jgi:hypothetical protein
VQRCRIFLPVGLESQTRIVWMATHTDAEPPRRSRPRSRPVVSANTLPELRSPPRPNCRARNSQFGIVDHQGVA